MATHDINGGRDERLSSLLAPIYRTGFRIMAGGILFDLYTRFNYIAQSGEGESILADSPLESAVLIVACLYVAIAQARTGVFSDSLRVLESQTFWGTGLPQRGLAIAALIAVAATGGRLYNEVILYGWGQVTWAGDVAMLIVLLALYAGLIVGALYLEWRRYRRAEERLAAEEE